MPTLTFVFLCVPPIHVLVKLILVVEQVSTLHVKFMYQYQAFNEHVYGTCVQFVQEE